MVENELSELDVSIATDNYKIAKECLANNNEHVYEMLCKTYPESFGATEIREWPIFVDFRETEYYSQFVSEHIEDFNMQEIELPENENITEECIDKNVENASL